MSISKTGWFIEGMLFGCAFCTNYTMYLARMPLHLFLTLNLGIITGMLLESYCFKEGKKKK